MYINFTLEHLPVLSVFSSSYQDIFSLLILFSPDVIFAFNDYLATYYTISHLNYTAAACFDSYTSNLNYNFGDGIISFFMFFFFT
jgi:hypothetical protein